MILRDWEDCVALYDNREGRKGEEANDFGHVEFGVFAGHHFKVSAMHLEMQDWKSLERLGQHK